jgi:O-antigen/teichoic acid export membrane protein
METTLKQKTAHGLFWGAFSNGGQQLISAVFGIFMMRILNENDYGLVGTLTIFTAIASIIINSGFSIALTNKQNVNHQDYNAVFWFTFFVGLILYIILFFTAPLIAQFYDKPALVNLSRFIFISFFISGIGTASYTVMFKKMMVKQQAIIDTISLLTGAVIGIILALKGFGYWALAIQSVIYISLISLLKFIIAPWKPSWQFSWVPIREMFSFTSKMFITNIFVQINNNFLTIIIGKLFGIGSLGFYSQGQKWANMGNQMLGGMINAIAQPVLVQVTNDKDRQVGILRKMIRFGAFVSFPSMLGLAFIGKEFIWVVGGEKWLPSVPFLQLFCVWSALVYLLNLFTNVVYVHGKSDIYMKIIILTGLLQLIVVLSLYRLGLFWMVTAFIGISFATLLLWQRYVHQLIGLTLRDILKDILPYLGITLACFFIAWIATINIQNIYWLLVSKIAISGFLYIFVMKISRSVIFKESVEFLTGFIKN